MTITPNSDALITVRWVMHQTSPAFSDMRSPLLASYEPLHKSVMYWTILVYMDVDGQQRFIRLMSNMN